MENIHVKFMKFGPVVQQEVSFKEKVYGQYLHLHLHQYVVPSQLTFTQRVNFGW